MRIAANQNQREHVYTSRMSKDTTNWQSAMGLGAKAQQPTHQGNHTVHYKRCPWLQQHSCRETSPKTPIPTPYPIRLKYSLLLPAAAAAAVLATGTVRLQAADGRPSCSKQRLNLSAAWWCSVSPAATLVLRLHGSNAQLDGGADNLNNIYPNISQSLANALALPLRRNYN